MKAKSVQIKKLKRPISFYDVTVPGCGNFMLEDCYVKNCDADADGSHINSLLLSLFTEFYRPLIEDGRVYVVDAPLFKASVSNKHVYGNTHKELKKKLGKKSFRKAVITRFKGHGEADSDEVREYAMDKKTRRLYKIVIRGKKDVRLMREIMGEGTAKRREIIGL